VTIPREPTPSVPEEAPGALRDQYGLVTATAQERPPDSEAEPYLDRVLSDALREEYGLLSSMLASVWSASLFRVSLFLGVVSAMGVALGLAAQAGGGFGDTFLVFALIALPLALFLGLATFVRTVELQREAYTYITGMNRIRHVVATTVPASRPYFVLSIHDDAAGVYRSQGNGIRLRPPRYPVLANLAQTQGIVAVICAALAAVLGGLATAWLAVAVAWAVGAVAFVAVLGGLMRYWRRSVAQLQAAIRPMFPTPAGEVDLPI
jgi:hypothetical protein